MTGEKKTDMPARRFTKAADTPKKRRQWQHVYKSAKKSGDSAGSAIRQANASVKKHSRRKRRKKK